MSLYEKLNFAAFFFMALLFLFVYFLTVQIAFKAGLYRTVRRIFQSRVEFWNRRDALRYFRRFGNRGK
ncbi:MAG: hypothetical protein GXO08_03000 [Aquificae bacterium]|nr:hypothetical protein [Aquificota bacterium]